MEFVTVFNRSSKPLKGLWNGREYQIPPGESTFPRIQAEKFRDQNPVMGSEDPFTLEKDYLIAIKEYGHDCSPKEQSTAKERWNRSLMANAGDVVIIKGNGRYAPQTDGSLPLTPTGPVDSAFVVPDK
jgi:hypothetical protein